MVFRLEVIALIVPTKDHTKTGKIALVAYSDWEIDAPGWGNKAPTTAIAQGFERLLRSRRPLQAMPVNNRGEWINGRRKSAIDLKTRAL